MMIQQYSYKFINLSCIHNIYGENMGRSDLLQIFIWVLSEYEYHEIFCRMQDRYIPKISDLAECHQRFFQETGYIAKENLITLF